MAAEAPTSYKDPYWSNLASNVESKLDLPKGLLVAIVNRGERSNADQVSEAGARTPFQIIPATRKAAIDKYGIDPYLSPENAAEVSGRLLQDSLKRNGGDPALAVAEYHGGTDRSNWGPKTKAYVQRVVGRAQDVPVADPMPLPDTPAMPDTSQPMAPGTSTFDRLAATMGKPNESQIANVYKAYSAGQMSPQDEQQFESDVAAGRIMLPRGATLKIDGQDISKPKTGSGAVTLPDAVVQAYTSGRMPVEDRIQLEQDVRSGAVKMPDGVEVHDTKAPGFLARMQESITGAQRRTEQSDALPDWATMPELNSFSMAGFKTGLGTLLSNPKETVQIIKANFPGVQVSQDDHGNYLLTSSIDGKQYAIKPGFQVSDIPRAAGAVAAFTPAGRAATLPGMALGAGATQAAIEASQAATGGEFNPGEVATAAVLAPVLPAAANLTRAVAAPVRQAVSRVLGRAEPGMPGAAADATAAAVPPPGVPVSETPAVVSPPAGSVAPRAPSVPANIAPAAPAMAAEMSAAELAQTAKTAAEGGMGAKNATQALAAQAAPNPKTLEAAKRLGIEDYLQPDHVTTNQAYRELAQAVKSIPGSEARAGELQGLEKVAQRADKLVSDIGGTTDASTLDAGVKKSLQATHAELDARANKLYSDLRDAIPAKTGAPARNVLDFVEQRAKDLGGKENLTPMEKQIVAKLSPKPITNEAGQVVGKTQPTYALLDDVRKDLGAAARAAGPFKDADTGLAKKLYGLLSDDQAAVVSRMGMADTYNAARQAVAVRKGIEDDLVSLFGKQVDGSLIGDLSGAMRSLPQGDSSKLIKLLNAVPPEMRQEVTASGLASAFRTAGTRGPISFSQFEKWYDGLLRNKQAHAALMSNLPPAARKQLSDLYRVSKGISAASRERIATGRIMAVQEQFKAADTLAGKLYEAAKRGAVGATVGTAAGSVMGPGVGAAIASALTKGAKPAADKAVDALIASPEFAAAVRAAGSPGQATAVRSLAYSKTFTRFVRAIGQPRELSNRERWILNALQAENNLNRGRDARN